VDSWLSDFDPKQATLTIQTLGEKYSEALQIVPVPKWVLTKWDRHTDDRDLLHADLQWTSEEFTRLRWGLLWIGLSGAIWIGFTRNWDVVCTFFSSILFASAVLAPRIWLRWKIERNQLETDLILPDFLDRLILGLNAGLGFELALRRSGETFPGRVGREARRMLRQIDRGHPRESVLEEFQYRLPSHEVSTFVSAVKQSDRLGTPLVKVLRVQSTLLRSRRRRRAQEASRRLPILIVFPLVFFFLPALLIIYLAPPLLMLFLQR
jgi:pilus assembly protein TadC